MSNSIWKTGYPKYEHDRSWDDIIQEYHREDGSKFYVVGDCSEPNDRWAYLTDIIAQADKAERLQTAVDKAIWILEESKKVQRPDFKLGFTYCLFPQPHLDIILDEIKQLIKENQ